MSSLDDGEKRLLHLQLFDNECGPPLSRLLTDMFRRRTLV